MTTIPDLGGIEKGENKFEIWTKGSEGSFITVKFEIGSEIFRYKLPAENQEWTKYDLTQSLTENKSLFIPDSINTIYVGIFCTELVTGEVKLSGMSLKSAQINEISPPPVLVSPSNGSSTIDQAPTFDWDDVSGQISFYADTRLMVVKL